MKLIIPELPGITGRQQILPFGASAMAVRPLNKMGRQAIVKCLIRARKEGLYETH